MNNPQEIANRIKVQTKIANKSVKILLETCELNKNFVNKIASGTDVGYQSIVKIADYLGCSVDYLLGRDIKKGAPDNIRDAIIAKINELPDESLVRLRGYLEALAGE